MRALLLLIAVSLAGCTRPAPLPASRSEAKPQAAQPASPVMRLQCIRQENGATFTQHGTAVAVDGRAFGLAPSVLLTAAHVVDRGEALVEASPGWLRATPAKRDEGLDLALLYPALPLDGALELDTAPLMDGARVEIIAAVEGQPVRSAPGIVGGRHGEHEIRWGVEARGFGHGSSGGAVLRGGKLAGLIVALVPSSQGEPCALVFIPALRIRHFLQDAGGRAP
ncbi:MAG: hypothetical protein AMXMBFR7_32800 [Planctomycetota bacterium]